MEDCNERKQKMDAGGCLGRGYRHGCHIGTAGNGILLERRDLREEDGE